jgi:transcriptional regulator with XRE-family HTH domain
MRERRVRPTTILTDAEVTTLVRGVRSVLGDGFGALVKSYGMDLEEGVRFTAVAKRCVEERAARGWTLKEVARQLKVARYRLRDIEAGHVRSVEPEVLHAYVSHLGLESWYGRWKRSSPDLATRLAPVGTKSQVSSSQRARSNNRMQLTKSAPRSAVRRRLRS